MKRIYLPLTIVLFTTSACLDPSADGNLVPKTVDDDPSLPRIALNNSLFHAEAFGDPNAPVIVMLHGGPGNDYRYFLRMRQAVDGRRLEDGHRVVFWDQRGSGLSRRHDPRDLTFEAFDADLLALLDAYAPGRSVVLIGHSWGGMYASAFIGQHPERVAGAVLQDCGPLTGALNDQVKSGIQSTDLTSEWLNDYTWSQTIFSPEDHARADYQRMLGNLGDAQPGFHLSTTDRAPAWRFGAIANVTLTAVDGVHNGKADWDFTKGLDHFTRPVLFEGSALNDVIGAEFQKRQVTFYPNAQLVVIADAGHDFQWTQPEATLRPIFTYLDAIGF
jgi:proline iminopeptidase